LPVSDLDVGDTLTASITGTPTLVWSGGSLSPAQQTALTAALVSGKLTFDSTATSDGGAKTIAYTYDAAAADLDFLRAGDTLKVTYAVQVGDGTTTSAAQNLVITINGTNDAPTITSGASASTPENVSTATAVYT